MLEVIRSPARVSWWVVYGNQTIATRPTRYEAQAEAERLSKKTGLEFKS